MRKNEFRMSARPPARSLRTEAELAADDALARCIDPLYDIRHEPIRCTCTPNPLGGDPGPAGRLHCYLHGLDDWPSDEKKT